MVLPQIEEKYSAKRARRYKRQVTVEKVGELGALFKPLKEFEHYQQKQVKIYSLIKCMLLQCEGMMPTLIGPMFAFTNGHGLSSEDSLNSSRESINVVTPLSSQFDNRMSFSILPILVNEGFSSDDTSVMMAELERRSKANALREYMSSVSFDRNGDVVNRFLDDPCREKLGSIEEKDTFTQSGSGSLPKLPCIPQVIDDMKKATLLQNSQKHQYTDDDDKGEEKDKFEYNESNSNATNNTSTHDDNTKTSAENPHPISHKFPSQQLMQNGNRNSDIQTQSASLITTSVTHNTFKYMPPQSIGLSSFDAKNYKSNDMNGDKNDTRGSISSGTSSSRTESGSNADFTNNGGGFKPNGLRSKSFNTSSKDECRRYSSQMEILKRLYVDRPVQPDEERSRDSIIPSQLAIGGDNIPAGLPLRTLSVKSYRQKTASSDESTYENQSHESSRRVRSDESSNSNSSKSSGNKSVKRRISYPSDMHVNTEQYETQRTNGSTPEYNRSSFADEASEGVMPPMYKFVLSIQPFIQYKSANIMSSVINTNTSTSNSQTSAVLASPSNSPSPSPIAGDTLIPSRVGSGVNSHVGSITVNSRIKRGSLNSHSIIDSNSTRSRVSSVTSGTGSIMNPLSSLATFDARKTTKIELETFWDANDFVKSFLAMNCGSKRALVKKLSHETQTLCMVHSRVSECITVHTNDIDALLSSLETLLIVLKRNLRTKKKTHKKVFPAPKFIPRCRIPSSDHSS
eukprot:TRINITY_DN12125_c0_g1_i3.p1 TRINITY_DN12125_c0_g1~~TRINITY_DN12125_c0_g1_i3.p1  ORF type:complete len:741 (-),score=182.54 TRINITY_DN12125_c0_g1_i3:270-2492(-)